MSILSVFRFTCLFFIVHTYIRRVALQRMITCIRRTKYRSLFSRKSHNACTHCDGNDAILSLGEFEHTVWHIHDSSIPNNSLISTSCRVHGILSKRRVSRL